MMLSKKRSRPPADDHDVSAPSSSHDNRKNAAASAASVSTSMSSTILHGVTVCLTGLPADAKEQWHALVEALGGRYTRDFLVGKNTHLIAAASNNFAN